MACDLQYTYGDSLAIMGPPKIIKLPEKTCNDLFGIKSGLMGFAGNADQWANVVSWLYSPEDKPPKLKDMELLLLTDKKEIYHASTLANWLEIKEPCFAIGSGMAWAMSAMSLGKTPKEAVKFSMKFDKNTGKGVKEFKL